MKDIEKYNLTEHLNKLYLEEASSSIGLAREVAVKVNELVDAYNELSRVDLDWKQTQEGEIRKAIIYIKDNLLNTLHELAELYKNEGVIADYVKEYTSNLERRIDNLLSSSSSDGELIDARYGADEVTYQTLGDAIRTQFKNIIDLFNNRLKISIESIEKGYHELTPALLDGHVYYNNGDYTNESHGGFYMRSNYIEIPLFAKKITHNFLYSDGSDGYAFYTKDKKYISGGKSEITEIPENAFYIMLTDYNISPSHRTEKTIKFDIDVNAELPNISQINTLLDSIIVSLQSASKGGITETLTFVDGFININTGELSNNGFDNAYKRSDYILIPMLVTEITSNVSFSAGSDGIGFYDSSYQFISGTKDTIITEIPENATYICITNYNLSGVHSDKYIKFKISMSDNKSSKKLGKLVTYGDSHVARAGWQNAVISHFGVTEHVNLGIGSTCVAENSKSELDSFVSDTRINAIKSANPDTIIIIGGTNDVHMDTPLGESSALSNTSKDKTTFYGAYSFLIETLLKWKPSLKVIICTVPQGSYDSTHSIKYSDISNAIKEIGNYYSLPIVDIFGKCGINKINLSTYSEDSIHYNSLGNQRIAELVKSTIENSYLE